MRSASPGRSFPGPTDSPGQRHRPLRPDAVVGAVASQVARDGQGDNVGFVDAELREQIGIEPKATWNEPVPPPRRGRPAQYAAFYEELTWSREW
ncbi:hypothetical protein [Salinispora arenicola]|uniref:hypothetical protein n=1 Tax=Salinispora arenicola TaxID=168697 RepID=UPI0003776174|nr:hypothetical protein [Salinispora arenicola]